ncbi:sulfatase [Namhaeicola litoreus]|uniref:Sulfatase n=1 Tax=Namhaeicola litoreus TaxID=1052145 RepID=A0ABW3Y3B1_9FLAO
MISVDDLNSYLGYLGDPNAITPNIDKLAESGVAFINAHCQTPLCGPSRASIMTGLRPSTTGIYGMIKDDSIRTNDPLTKSVVFLPEVFKNNGYDVLGVGKIFHTYAPKDLFKGPGRFVGEKPNNNFGPAPKQRMAWQGYRPGNKNEGPRTNTDWGAFPDQDSLVSDFKAANWAKNQIEKEITEKPFFLAVGFLKPHVPLHVPQKWFDMYPLEKIVVPPYLVNDMDDVPEIAKNHISKLAMMPTTDWAIETDNWKKIIQAYLACVSFVDHQIGVVLDALKNSQYADNTIVVLWSDHGYRVGEKGTFAKQALWEEATRAPLIFSGPGITKNKKINAPVELLSIYPTLLDLCKLPKNDHNEGISLTPLMKDQYNGEKLSAITTYGWNNHSVRTINYRYIKYEDGSEELYDKQKDPNEFVNLANTPQYQKEKEKLALLLPITNNKWNKYSSYSFEPYFIEQKERVNGLLIGNNH